MRPTLSRPSSGLQDFALAAALLPPVAQVDDARVEGARLEQLEVDLLVERREERRAAAHQDGMDEQLELVDEPEPGVAPRERGAADADDAVRLLPHPRELLREALGREPRVALDLRQGAREHDLGQRLPQLREVALDLAGVRILIGGLPVAHRLVEVPAEEMRALLPDAVVVE